MKITSPATILDFSPYRTNSNGPTHNLGEMILLSDFRAFRYIKAGGSNISVGKLQLSPAPDTSLHNMDVVAAAAIGAMSVTITPGATTASVGAFDQGYLVVNAGVGVGYTYSVEHSPVIASATNFILTLQDGLVVALDATSDVTLYANNCNGVVEGTSSTQQPIGIPLVSITAAYFGWAQTKGVVAALADETLTLGAQLTAGTSTSGALEEYDDTGSAPQTDNMVGWAVVAGVDTEYRPVFLTID